MIHAVTGVRFEGRDLLGTRCQSQTSSVFGDSIPESLSRAARLSRAAAGMAQLGKALDC